MGSPSGMARHGCTVALGGHMLNKLTLLRWTVFCILVAAILLYAMAY
jgi:hypothetical protein